LAGALASKATTPFSPIDASGALLVPAPLCAHDESNASSIVVCAAVYGVWRSRRSCRLAILAEQLRCTGCRWVRPAVGVSDSRRAFTGTNRPTFRGLSQSGWMIRLLTNFVKQ
jgi:hypothetical protein